MANQGTFSSGDVLTAADLNAFAQVTIVNQGGLVVPNSTNTIPAFNTEVIDVGGWHTGTNSYVAPTVTGVYTVTALAYDLNGTTRGVTHITINGSVVSKVDTESGRSQTVTWVGSVTAGQQVSMFVWQQSGVTRFPFVSLSVQLVRAT